MRIKLKTIFRIFDCIFIFFVQKYKIISITLLIGVFDDDFY
ncbi:hypothetical protein FEM08_08020 [Flavobacterium gilvum]|nr:hypothetical protein FEM08_08020 [Flavobacterium gilvum]